MVTSPLVLIFVIFASRFGSILFRLVVSFTFKPLMFKGGLNKGRGTFGMIMRVNEVSALAPPLMRPERVTT